ncbi:hypothetical protein PBRA_004282 [Plasmodiophora brassicae]|uniref:Uncharacterized protein n=1 Tax=Plasmodiophora brassicae TaxID=37360 RepID=A0A0G4IKE8_PLABS|nr:hypothetical protein PBRA_004282 [Plasmodiophora brassicae]
MGLRALSGVLVFAIMPITLTAPCGFELHMPLREFALHNAEFAGLVDMRDASFAQLQACTDSVNQLRADLCRHAALDAIHSEREWVVKALILGEDMPLPKITLRYPYDCNRYRYEPGLAAMLQFTLDDRHIQHDVSMFLDGTSTMLTRLEADLAGRFKPSESGIALRQGDCDALARYYDAVAASVKEFLRTVRRSYAARATRHRQRYRKKRAGYARPLPSPLRPALYTQMGGPVLC